MRTFFHKKVALLKNSDFYPIFEKWAQKVDLQNVIRSLKVPFLIKKRLLRLTISQKNAKNNKLQKDV